MYPQKLSLRKLAKPLMNDDQIIIAIESLKLFLWGLLIAAGLFSGTILICLGVDFYRMHFQPHKGRRRMKVKEYSPPVDGQTVVLQINQLRRRRLDERSEFFKNVQEML